MTATLKACRVCGTPGHRRETCPEGKGKEDADLAQEILRIQREEGISLKQVAAEMGIEYWHAINILRKAGHTGGKHRARAAPSPIPLTAAEYQRVQACRQAGWSSLLVAEYIPADLAEVNAAWSTISFEHYLNTRKQ